MCVTDVESRGWERREWGDKSVCVYERERVGDGRECENVKVGGGREREYDDGGDRVGDGGEKVGSGRGSGRGRERGNGNVCKRDKVGDGRESECERE